MLDAFYCPRPTANRDQTETSTEYSPRSSEVELSTIQFEDDSNHASNRESDHHEEASQKWQELQDYDLETLRTFAILCDHNCFLLCCVAMLIGALYFVILSRIIK